MKNFKKSLISEEVERKKAMAEESGERSPDKERYDGKELREANELKWELFDSLDELRASLKKILDNLTAEAIASLTGWQFIIDGLSVANI